MQMLNWEYDWFEQQLRPSVPEVQEDAGYSPNGEWRFGDSFGCGRSQDFPGEGPLGFVNVRFCHLQCLKTKLLDTGVVFRITPLDAFGRQNVCCCILSLQYYMVLERKSRYSVINVLLPIVLLSLMDLLVFWLPAESGEKVSLGITVLLSFSVFLLVVDERMPRTSDAVPILSEYPVRATDVPLVNRVLPGLNTNQVEFWLERGKKFIGAQCKKELPWGRVSLFKH